MLPRNSILRSVPNSIVPLQVLEIGAFVFSTDVVAASFRRIVELASKFGSDLNAISDSDRIAMIVAAWTIVDHVHAIREISKAKMFAKSEQAVAFKTKYESATLLRNKLDHLASNIPNLASSTMRRPPVFGVLSYFVSGPIIKGADGIPKIGGGEIVTLMAGNLTHDTYRLGMANPIGRTIRLPVSLFRFEAFDQALELDAMVADLERFTRILNEKFGAAVEAALEAKSKESGISITDLKKSRGGGLMAAVTIEFEPSPVFPGEH